MSKEEAKKLAEEENREESPENGQDLQGHDASTDRVLELEKALEDAEANTLRAYAELENTKKRLGREKEDFLKYASEKVVLDMLPIIDNLELALMHGGDNQACHNLVQGVEMTHKMFLETLERHGVTPVGGKGVGFDPNFHEACGFEQDPALEEGCICQIIQKGYMLNGRLIRPAKVLVNKSG